ncbi:hypothetical protein ACFBZI_11440 [Moraxella sp. ZJ142]|uniref:hypothetical protein n=1 Tax=Moraxella marmotae TaxID=3344520 RepID=UPI0035D4C4AF
MLKYKTLPLAMALTLVAGSANAVTDFVKNPGAVAQIQQADQLSAALEINASQTALHAQEVAKRSLYTTINKTAVKIGIEQAKTIKQAIDDTTYGVGITTSMGCESLQQQKLHTARHELSSQVKTAIMQSNAGTRYRGDGFKRALRAKNHYDNYCDVSEAAQGICLPSFGAQGGMSTNYSTINNNLTLTDEQVQAGYAYTRNVIDPGKTDDSFCQTSNCRDLAKNEEQYHTMGSMIQNSFMAQIQSSVAWDTPPTGLAPVTIEQTGELSGAWDGRVAHPDSGMVSNQPGGAGGNFAGERPQMNLVNLPPELKEIVIDLFMVILSGESKSYEAFNRPDRCKGGAYGAGDGKTTITQMTLAQINATYNGPCSSALFAVGRFQIIPDTRKGLVNAHPNLRQYLNQPFTKDVQDLFGYQLLYDRISSMINGKSFDVNKAQYALSQEWAAVPMPIGFVNKKGVKAENKNTGYYDGGRNKSAKGIYDPLRAQLERLKVYHQQKHQTR